MKKKFNPIPTMIVDMALVCLSFFLGFCIRADFQIKEILVYYTSILIGFPLIAIIFFILFYTFKIYRILWQYSNYFDFIKMCSITVMSYVIFAILHYYLICPVDTAVNDIGTHLFPRAVYLIGCLLAVAFLLCSKAFIYVINRKKTGVKEVKSPIEGNIMIIGAGKGASLLISDIQNNPYIDSSSVKCMIDDDPSKIGSYIHGIKVYGNRTTISRAVKEFDIKIIIFAVPSCPDDVRSEILSICSKTGCSVKVMPGASDIINGKIGLADMRDIKIEDLLGRKPIKIDIEKTKSMVHNKVVMVTGGGGSIGSELCRQIAHLEPKQLIIFDVYENNAYDIQNELKRRYPELNLITLIGSVRDTDRLECIFKKYKPQVIYHAAAHKHVPLMEDSPHESIKNNVFGTYKTATMASKYGAEKFVLISTDKAVNPTNIMGASKRMCEMVIQILDRHSETDFAAVRFGNVLGSNGSVIPLFKRQIAEGGPITVTHPEIIRYFMTIPEAVSLVLSAGAYAKGGEIFILDMGKPVKIVDLAENLIRLSGFEPYRDINIVFTGLRPGEKLYEELLMSEEGMTATENELIHIGKPLNIDEEKFMAGLMHLREVMYDDSVDIRSLVEELVPTYVRKD